jgi:gamma-glutamyltranspeptidase / glutathione hydrolase
MHAIKFRSLVAFAFFCAAILAPAFHAEAQERSQARSMVMTKYGIVAAENPLAAQAGADILARGGSAADAAITANAVMGVVEPMMNGIGGDLFVIVYDAKPGKLYGLNASGWAPKGLTIDFLKAHGHEAMPQTGIQSVTVPGAVDGWSKLLQRFGHKNLKDVLAPAISYADEGFPVPEWTAAYWTGAAGTLKSMGDARKVYLPNGHPPKAGELFRNPDLAASLKLLASGGPDAYYRGPIGRKIAAFSTSVGGTMTPEDLADYSSEWVDPVSTTYHGWTVYELPPNSQGMAALEMLNIMEHFPLAKYGPNSVDALHAMIEAKKLAYADLLRFNGDPKFSKVPVAGLLSKDYAAGRAKLIDPEKANCNVPPGAPPEAGRDTTYLSVVDKDGNMISLIQSNYSEFGSGLVADGTGFILHNRGGLFTLDPASPNALAGHKRPFQTIIPAFMEKGDTRIAFGIMGGANQAQAHAQFVSNVVDFEMNIQAALEAARFTKYTYDGCDVEVENRIPASVLSALAKLGHMIQPVGSFSADMGGGQSVERNFTTGVNFGGSDPRKDGEAVPESPFRRPDE